MKRLLLILFIFISILTLGTTFSGCVDYSNNGGDLIIPEDNENQDEINPPSQGNDNVNDFFKEDVSEIKKILLENKIFKEQEIEIDYQSNYANLICSSQNLGLDEYGKIDGLLKAQLENDVYIRLNIKLENNVLYIKLLKNPLV